MRDFNLYPCPVCNKSNAGFAYELKRVMCNECKWCGPFGHTPEEAVTSWNAAPRPGELTGDGTGQALPAYVKKYFEETGAPTDAEISGEGWRVVNITTDDGLDLDDVTAGHLTAMLELAELRAQKLAHKTCQICDCLNLPCEIFGAARNQFHGIQPDSFYCQNWEPRPATGQESEQ